MPQEASVESVMISCVQRRYTERPRTLAQLARANIRPVITESSCNPAGGPLNRLAAWNAISAVRGDCLFVEDDIDVNSDLMGDFLDMAKASDEVVTFTCFRESLHPKGILAKKDSSPRLVEMVNTKDRRGFYGTQAIYLPAWAVSNVKASMQDFVKMDGSPLDDSDGFDFWIKENIGKILMAFPNPVQHRDPPKMRSITNGESGKRGTHKSLSYHLGVNR